MQYDQNQPLAAGLPLRDRVAAAKRHPVRVTITVADAVHVALVDRSMREGRSVSNLAASLLERALMHTG